VVFAVSAGLLAACGGTTPSSQLTTKTTGTSERVANEVPNVPSGSTLLADFHANAPSSEGPGEAPSGTVPATWHNADSVLPVIASRDNWVEVRLAQRPNESTTWVEASEVSFSSTPYRIVVDLATTHLQLYKSNTLVMSAPIGIGITQSPTPTGQYFVAFFAQPPSAGYGPFVMVTSAHSNAITDWEESGDAMIAVHGPLGASSQIGTTGAAVSHGCIRLQLADLSQLRAVPVGSPLNVVAQ
jgi:lipoprotein-anchoring transpeptidase ErfK/SrfK